MEAIEAVLEKNEKDGGKLPKKLGDLYNIYAGTAGEIAQPEESKAKPEPVSKKKPVKKEEASKPATKPVVEKKEVAKKPVAKSVAPFTASELTFDNCPDDYASLKAEAKELAVSSGTSFLLLAQRLVVIRDGELYKEDGYKSFSDFIAGEIKVSRSTVYNYIDLVGAFGVQTFGHDNSPDPSKLIPALPLLKASDEQISKADKKDLRSTLVKEAKTKSARELDAEIKELKVKHGLVAEKVEVDKLDACFDRLISLLPEKLNAVDKTKLKRYIKKLQGFVE